MAQMGLQVHLVDGTYELCRTAADNMMLALASALTVPANRDHLS